MSEVLYRLKPVVWDRIWYGATATTAFGTLFVSNRKYEDRADSDRWAYGIPSSRYGVGIWWHPASSGDEAKAGAEAWYRERAGEVFEPVPQ